MKKSIVTIKSMTVEDAKLKNNFEDRLYMLKAFNDNLKKVLNEKADDIEPLEYKRLKDNIDEIDKLINSYKKQHDLLLRKYPYTIYGEMYI